MGQRVIPPRNKYASESDEDYQHYLQGDYKAYLRESMARAKLSMLDMAITLMVIALITLVLLAVLK